MSREVIHYYVERGLTRPVMLVDPPAEVINARSQSGYLFDREVDAYKQLLHWAKNAEPAAILECAAAYAPTRLEYFAGLAMQGLLANYIDSPESCARWSVERAQALMAELDKVRP